MLNQNPDEFVLKQIKNLCNERNWSLYRLSMESSIPYSTLNNLFRRGNVPSISTLCKICDAFHMSLSEFFADNNDALSFLLGVILPLYTPKRFATFSISSSQIS